MCGSLPRVFWKRKGSSHCACCLPASSASQVREVFGLVFLPLEEQAAAEAEAAAALALVAAAAAAELEGGSPPPLSAAAKAGRGASEPMDADGPGAAGGSGAGGAMQQEQEQEPPAAPPAREVPPPAPLKAARAALDKAAALHLPVDPVSGAASLRGAGRAAHATLSKCKLPGHCQL